MPNSATHAKPAPASPAAGGQQTYWLAAIDSKEINHSSGGRNFYELVSQSSGSKTETLQVIKSVLQIL